MLDTECEDMVVDGDSLERTIYDSQEDNKDGNMKEESEEKNDTKKEKKEEEKKVEEKKKKTEEKRDENVFLRVKERLSMRSKKKEKQVKDMKVKKEKKIVENQIEIEDKPKLAIPDEKKHENGQVNKVEKNKDANVFQRLFKRLSFRSKKKNEKSPETKVTESENTKEEANTDIDQKLQEDTASSCKTSIGEDVEISALCVDGNEGKESSPSILIMHSSRPPLPSIRRPPSSASTAQTRPVSQLDAALRQFKQDTVASRENLRSSRVDISMVEEKVRTMVTSRPSTPTPAGWRSRAPPANTKLDDQWRQLSASLTDLR